jgi:hypothetical protein
MSNDSPASPSIETPSLTEAAPHANPYGAVPMVPSAEDDPPLSAAELEMRFGHPVIHRQVDYSRLARFYRQAVLGGIEDNDFAAWRAMPLGDFHQAADMADMAYCHRLLVFRDQYLLENADTKGFYAWLKDHQGYEQTDRTLRRQISHARMALILAASGKIDLLPSQNSSATIASLLPREAWGDFLSAFPLKEAGKATLQRKIVGFADRQNIPLRMTPLSLPQSSPPPETEPTAIELAASPAPETAGETTPATDAQTAPPDQLPEKLAPAMAGFAPQYWLAHQSETQMAKRMVRLMKTTIKAAPRPARHAQRIEFHRQLATHSPQLTEQITLAALQYFYDSVEKELPQFKKEKPDRRGANSPKTEPGHGVSGSDMR